LGFVHQFKDNFLSRRADLGVTIRDLFIAVLAAQNGV
jgi:hypothetical protein